MHKNIPLCGCSPNLAWVAGSMTTKRDVHKADEIRHSLPRRLRLSGKTRRDNTRRAHLSRCEFHGCLFLGFLDTGGGVGGATEESEHDDSGDDRGAVCLPLLLPGAAEKEEGRLGVSVLLPQLTHARNGSVDKTVTTRRQ